VSPQDAAAASTMHRGSHRSTPIVGSCYFCRDQNRKQWKARKSCAVVCSLFAMNIQYQRQRAIFVKITESAKDE